MAEGKEYLRHLLSKAISSPKADVVDFKALRTLLETSIEHMDASQHSSLAKINEKRKKIQEDLKHLDDEKLVVSVGLPEEGICVSTNPVSLQLSKVTSDRLQRSAPASSQPRDSKIQTDRSHHQISEKSKTFTKTSSNSSISQAKPSKSSGSKENLSTEKHIKLSTQPIARSASNLSFSTPKLDQSSESKISMVSAESHKKSDQNKSIARSASSLSLTATKSNKSSRSNKASEIDDKIERKGIFSHRESKSSIQDKSKETIGIFKQRQQQQEAGKSNSRVHNDTSAKDNELTVVVNLPKELICESRETTEIMLQIKNGDAIVTQVSQGDRTKSKTGDETHFDSDDERKAGVQRSKSSISDKSGVSEKPHLSEKWSAVNVERHEMCGHGAHDVEQRDIEPSKSNINDETSMAMQNRDDFITPTDLTGTGKSSSKISMRKSADKLKHGKEAATSSSGATTETDTDAPIERRRRDVTKGKDHRINEVVHKSVRDKLTDSSANRTPTHSSGAASPSGIFRKTSKESIRSRSFAKDKKEIGPSRRDMSVESGATSDSRGKWESRNVSRDGPKSTAGKHTKEESTLKRATSSESKPSQNRHETRSTSKESKISKSASVNRKDISGSKQSSTIQGKTTSVNTDKQPQITGIRASSLSESDSKTPSRPKHDQTNAIKSTHSRQPTGMVDHSSDQSPRSRAAAKDIMKRPQIISDPNLKHLVSAMEVKAKRPEIPSKFQKFKKGLSRLEQQQLNAYQANLGKSSTIESAMKFRKCECNALRNSNVCNCNSKVCLYSKSCRNPRICFCANSYTRGSDGVIYHTKCNCFDNE